MIGERLAGAVPARRHGTIADIALLVLSDAGSNLNGAVIPSDGGLCLVGNPARALDAASDR